MHLSRIPEQRNVLRKIACMRARTANWYFLKNNKEIYKLGIRKLFEAVWLFVPLSCFSFKLRKFVFAQGKATN